MSCLGLFLDSKLILEEQREGLFSSANIMELNFVLEATNYTIKAKQLSHEPLH